MCMYAVVTFVRPPYAFDMILRWRIGSKVKAHVVVRFQPSFNYTRTRNIIGALICGIGTRTQHARIQNLNYILKRGMMKEALGPLRPVRLKGIL